jgi:hypothetical protein
MVKKIFFFSPNYTDACSYYRGIAPFSFLKAHLSVPSGSVNWANIVGNDIAFLQRPCTTSHLQIAQLIKKQNIPLWLDYDDDLLNIPKDNPAYGFFAPLRENVVKVIKLADVITVTTAALQDLYHRINPSAKVIVIPNAWNDYIWGTKRNENPRDKLIMWRGSDSHVKDLISVSDRIISVSKGNPEYKFLFLGMLPWFLEGKMEYLHAPPVDIMEYFPTLHKINPQITIIPLEDNIFNKSKSNINWIEATMGGSIALAPRYLSEFNDVGTGLITYVDNIDFEYKLAKLIRNPNYCMDLCNISYNYIIDNLLLSNINNKRQEIIDSL